MADRTGIYERTDMMAKNIEKEYREALTPCDVESLKIKMSQICADEYGDEENRMTARYISDFLIDRLAPRLCRDGCVCVPDFPSAAMMGAGVGTLIAEVMECENRGEVNDNADPIVLEIWSAMIGAANE